MSSINSVSSNYAVNKVDFPPAKSGGQDLILTFSPEQIGAKRGRDNQFPPEARFTSTQAEKALFRFFGLNPDDPKDLQKIKARLATDGKSPFDVLQASTNYPARLNRQTGRYEAVFRVSQKTYDQLRGKIEQIKNELPSPDAKPLREPNPNDFFAAQQKLKLQKQMPPSRLEIEGLTAEQKALLLDLTDIGLSVVGIFEPTPFADLAGTGLALSRGEYGGAAISALGMFPYLGDLAKLGKLPKFVKVLGDVVQMAKQSPAFAKAVTPLLEKIKVALDNLPIEKLPQKAQDAVKTIKNKIDELFAVTKVALPKITFDSKQLQKKFKHAADFGVTGNYNAANALKFQTAIENHIASPGAKIIQGTYRGNPVTHIYNPNTGINVIVERTGEFISGWKLNPAQANNVVNRGSL